MFTGKSTVNHSQEIRRGVRSAETEGRWWGPWDGEGDGESVFNGDTVNVEAECVGSVPGTGDRLSRNLGGRKYV